ncbi:PCYCGC motif-containing (lipo)protein [Paenibacillus cisolokensis]|uniref:PCYCGC motif-containing (lipo)protein n=1 Tax=Paenibacillus cisolokensis TaxID=1658519 RepID=UPI003D279EC6
MTRKMSRYMILLLSTAIVLGGCQAGKTTDSDSAAAGSPAGAEQEYHAAGDTPGEHDHLHHASGDLREVTASIEELPTFLDGAVSEMRTIYALAAQVSDVLEYMPCYCGCGDSAGHQSNLNCFIHEIREDGSVEWDDHGTRCGVCLDIAVESALMRSDGMHLSDIRAAIDEKYKTGYAAPTRTPLPPAES